jgi:hypothetical protein
MLDTFCSHVNVFGKQVVFNHILLVMILSYLLKYLISGLILYTATLYNLFLHIINYYHTN